MSVTILTDEALGWHPSNMAEILERLEITTPAYNDFKTLEGFEVYVKLGPPVSVRRRIKHALRWAAPWRRSQRMREYLNLQRLRANAIPAPRPLIVAVERSAGFVSRQMMALERIPGTADLRTLAEGGAIDAARLPGMLRTLGGLVGGMHAAGFRHRDLFLRNILYEELQPVDRFHFIDCHNGSWSPLRFKGIAYDLACFEKWAGRFFSVEDREQFYAGYLDRHAVDLVTLLPSVDRARRHLVRRYLGKRFSRGSLKPELEIEAIDLGRVAELREGQPA